MSTYLFPDPTMDAIAGLTDTQINDVALEGGGIVYLSAYPRTGGETDDSPRLGRALAAMSTLGAKVLQCGAETYTLATAVNITLSDITIRGAGEKATVFQVTANVVAFNVTGHYVTIEHLLVDTTTTARTVFPVLFTNANKGTVRSCYFNGDDAGSRRSGVSFVGGSMGVVDSCTFNHACIRIATWDVMVTNCWIWAMTCDYGVGIFDGAGNATLNLVHVVPPEVSNANGIAGILIDGASGNPFSTSLTDIYLDGNPSLNLRQGIYVGDGAGLVTMNGGKANRMDSDCIVVDSAYGVTISDWTFHTNNEQGNGSRDIFVTQTGSQPTEKIMILGCTHVRTAAVTGTAGPAVEVHSSVGGVQVFIHDFTIKQPIGGGGYSLPEIKVWKSGDYPSQSMSGSGQLSRYRGTGSQAVSSSATTATINLGPTYPMAYRARPSQIQLNCETTAMPAYKIAYNSDDQILVTFVSAFPAGATIHWAAHLLR